jgi:hypothetical protein
MIELIFLAHMEALYEMEREKRWHEQFVKASAPEKKLMLERREEEKREKIAERRHQEQIRAQEKIAEAIRFSAILRS